jgi:(2R)-3-sulfolactate dehydrogenase (NADP+)
MPLVSLERLDALVRCALAQAGASGEMAAATAAALVSAEAQGLASHGLSRGAPNAPHQRNGRAVGPGAPRDVNEEPAAGHLDARNAHP